MPSRRPRDRVRSKAPRPSRSENAADRPPPAEADAPGALEWVGWCMVSACIACRIAFPSEDASRGTGIDVLPLELACGVVGSIVGWMRCRPAPRPVVVLPAIAFLGFIWLSAWFAEYRYAAMVMAWEWTGAAAVCWLIWSLARPAQGLRVPTAVVGLALGLGLAALWQVAIEYPELRRQFERQDPSILRQIEEMGIEAGSPTERLFVDRLYAREPYGSFGHPNSLAALMVLALPLTLAMSWRPGAGIGLRLGAWISPTIVLVTLVLTKSRSGWLASAGVVAVSVWPIIDRKVPRRMRILVGLVAGALLVAMIAFALWRSDRLILSETPKSLAYRIEWWTASWQVVREHPWVGVGFGNFAAHYLKHKLPFSSEEIADPHNFVMELVCVGGLGLLLSYLWMVVGSVRVLSSGNEPPAATQPGSIRGSASLDLACGTGAIIGIVWASALSFLSWTIPICLALGVGIIHGLGSGPLLSGEGGRRRIAIAMAAVHVHWLVSGGVAFPGLFLPMWALVAAALSTKNGLADASSRWSACAATAIWASAVILFVNDIYWPASLRDPIERDCRSYSQRNKLLWAECVERMANAEPRDQSGWISSALTWQTLMDPSRPDLAQRAYSSAQAAWHQAIALQPARAENYRALARLHRQASQLPQPGDALERGVDAYRQTLERYPNSAIRRWEYADTLRNAGDFAEAVEQYQLALTLDQTPHPDKKLSDAQRRFAEWFLRESD